MQMIFMERECGRHVPCASVVGPVLGAREAGRPRTLMWAGRAAGGHVLHVHSRMSLSPAQVVGDCPDQNTAFLASAVGFQEPELQTYGA